MEPRDGGDGREGPSAGVAEGPEAEGGAPPKARRANRSRPWADVAQRVKEAPGVYLDEVERAKRTEAIRKAGLLPKRGRPAGVGAPPRHPPEDPKWAVFRSLLRIGLSRHAALTEVGVSPPTYRAYLERAERGEPGWAEWAEANQRAAQGPEKDYLRTIHKAGKEDPVWAEKGLKLLYRDRYSEKSETVHTVRSAPAVNLDALSEDELEAYLTLREKMEKFADVPRKLSENFAQSEEGGADGAGCDDEER